MRVYLSRQDIEAIIACMKSAAAESSFNAKGTVGHNFIWYVIKKLSKRLDGVK